MYKNRKNINYWDGIENNNLERNCYDKDGKRWWNDEKEKWVKYKLKDKLINKSFYRYEFEYFGKNECESLFNNEINYDRVLKFIDLVYRRFIYNKSSNGLIKYLKGGYVRVLNSDFLGILGNSKTSYNDNPVRNWEYVINILRDNEIIDFNKNYNSYYDRNKKLWWVKLNSNFFSCEKKRILIENENLLRYLRKKNETIYNQFDERNKWELESGKLLSLDLDDDKLNKIINDRYNSKKEENIDKLNWEILSDKSDKSVKKKIIKKWVNDISYDFDFDCWEDEYKSDLKNKYHQFKDVLNNIQNNNYLDGRFFVDDFGFRYYNIISNLNRNYRKELKLDGEEIIEVDIRNSYISFLFCFIGLIVEFEKDKSFGKELFEQIRQRCNYEWGFDFYSFYNDLVFQDYNNKESDFYSIIKGRLFGLESTKYSRNYIKEIVNRIINSSDLVLKNWNINNLNIDEIKERIFLKDGKEFIDKVKNIELNDILKIKKGYKKYNNLNVLVGRLESEIMRKCMDKLIDEDIKFISLFDSFLIKKVEHEKVLIILNNVVKNYGNKLRFK